MDKVALVDDDQFAFYSTYRLCKEYCDGSVGTKSKIPVKKPGKGTSRLLGDKVSTVDAHVTTETTVTTLTANTNVQSYGNDFEHTTMDLSMHNMCPDCPDTIMVIHLSEYKCPSCLRTESADITVAEVRSTMHGRFTEYSKCQRDVVSKQLHWNNEKFGGIGDKFQKDILETVADQYNMIQKNAKLDVYDIDGNAVGKKKFVKRSNVKNEIIAALLFFECNRRKIPRKPKDIAQFMCLQADGFSVGEDTVRQLISDGLTDLEITEEPYEGFAARYLETLEQDNHYIDFCKDIIDLADDKNIGLSSLPPSKVAGCIWMLSVQCRWNLSIDKIESACDNTKKNTFIKFYNAICKNKKRFLHIFQQYNIDAL
jgi:hypothetical protein